MIVISPQEASLEDSVCGADIPPAMLEFIRNNDIAVMEGCDKVE